MPDVYTISQLTSEIRQLIESSPTMKDTWVQGEVSNMRVASPSGHWYFTLKDDKAQLKCVMWKNNAARQSNVPSEGDQIAAHGYISVYDQRGEYQLYADFVRPVGVGDLYAQFERLKIQLEAEGLFDPAHKQPLPTFPLRIGVVTSPSAAAFQDILNVLRRRFPIAEVILSPTLVQGYEAPPLIASALRRLDVSGAADVIILARGGGSIEDLWAFNDEQVARAIYESTTPIISGVGHETDFTIADFVADQRAPTPSAAAELVTPDITSLQNAVTESHIALKNAFDYQLVQRSNQINTALRSLSHLSPISDIQNYRQRVDEWMMRLQSLQHKRLELLHERLDTKQQALEAASPKAILKHGYAIIQNKTNNAVIRSKQQVAPGTSITITLADGTIDAKIEESS